VQIGGVPLTEVANDELRRRLIVVPQEPFLFANTIEYNLQFANPEATPESMFDSFNELGLSDWLESLPSGLQTQVGQRGSSLSAGERQLVALVRASIVKPDVLVLDEATSSVDSLTEVRISHALERLAVGRTTISIAHRLSTASRADRVIMLENGRIVEDGSHLALLSAGGRYASLACLHFLYLPLCLQLVVSLKKLAPFALMQPSWNPLSWLRELLLKVFLQSHVDSCKALLQFLTERFPLLTTSLRLP
jgi:ABC-type multidrug transport system fused ATPase/permease subunit